MAARSGGTRVLAGLVVVGMAVSLGQAPGVADDQQVDIPPSLIDVVERCVQRFEDVTVDSTHAVGICVHVELGIFRGRPDGTFGAEDPVSRAAVATVLARILGLDTDRASEFPDLPEDAPHAGAVAAMVDAGLLAGRADGTFGPWAPVSRAQLASILAAARDLTATVDPGYLDVAEDSTHFEGIAAVSQAGIMRGVAPGRFAPDAVVTRGQLATALLYAFALDAEFALP